MKKIIILLVLVAAVAGGYYLLNRRGTERLVEVSGAQSKDVIDAFTGEGYTYQDTGYQYPHVKVGNKLYFSWWDKKDIGNKYPADQRHLTLWLGFWDLDNNKVYRLSYIAPLIDRTYERAESEPYDLLELSADQKSLKWSIEDEGKKVERTINL